MDKLHKDHWVTLPDGTIVYNPMRVIENGQGSEINFTLYWMPNRTEEEFEQDAKAVSEDLKRLEKIWFLTPKKLSENRMIIAA
ncbi:hypothetical protein ACFOET_18285 [Parapedobacter deserti]|uniref:Uncharacterized protein n=1 Tax=Parapedobacter deserti TaxID=1912957 RepID=A0ABV7JS24_9SPHI